MPQEDGGLQLWIAAERYEREKRELERAAAVSRGREKPSLRQRAGRAFIGFGERLAGERRPSSARRLATRPS